MAEHDQITNRLGLLRRAVARGDASLVAAAADHLDELFTPHAHAEEVGLFTVLREEADFTAHIDRLCGEHQDLDSTLQAIRAGDHGLLPAFEDALRDHMDREDNGLFPAAAVALAGPEWERVDALTPPLPT